jgi:hypothetical protein
MDFLSQVFILLQQFVSTAALPLIMPHGFPKRVMNPVAQVIPRL